MIDPTKAEEMREAIEYEIRMGVDLSLAINMTAPQHEEHIGEMSRKITDIFTSALEAQDVESKRDIVFHILMTKTEGFYDDGDLFIKRGPVEQAMIDKVGYEAFKAIKEAVNAADLAELQSHPTKQSKDKS